MRACIVAQAPLQMARAARSPGRRAATLRPKLQCHLDAWCGALAIVDGAGDCG